IGNAAAGEAVEGAGADRSRRGIDVGKAQIAAGIRKAAHGYGRAFAIDGAGAKARADLAEVERFAVDGEVGRQGNGLHLSHHWPGVSAIAKLDDRLVAATGQ